MQYDVIIAGAGSSQRAGVDKLQLKISNKTVLQKSIELFKDDEECNKIIIVTSKSKFKNFCNEYYKNDRFKIALGGSSRQESIFQGLKLCDSEFVMIHDAARPFLTETLVNRMKSKLDLFDAVIPTVKIVDTLLEKKGNNITYLNRNNLLAIQTPQAFRTEKIILAYIKNMDKLSDYTDDSKIYFDYFGNDKYITLEGDVNNIKITYVSDLK